MFLLPLLLILSAALGQPAAVLSPVFVPVAEARRLARNDPGKRVCVQGVVTVETGVLRSGPRDVYVQDASGGIVVQGTGSGPVARAAAVAACGVLQMYDDLEPELGQAEVQVLGKGRAPRAESISVEEAIDGVSAGKLVQVRGRVQRISIGETRDALWIGERGPELRAYLRREKSDPPALAQAAQVGAEVELAGILIPEERDKFQIRLRSAGDVVLVHPPEPQQLRVLRVWLLAALGLALAAGLWVALLKRAVRRQTAEIRRLMLEARQSEQAKSQFLANMSHEMRTPLNGILGMTELALESRPDPELRSYLETVRSSARALVEIVDDVLDLSRIEKGKMRFDPHPFALRAMVRDLLPLFEPQARQKGLRLELDLDGRLPETVAGDAGRIRQVLVNLLGNAVKFTRSGWVRLAAAPAGEGLVRFSVSDSGPGIAPEKQREIFRAFVQGDGSSTRQYGGAGLGLTISDHLVRLMGGEMKLSSRPGHGSEFSFVIPLPAVAGQEAAPPHPDSVESFSRGLRILVAEDNEINRRTLDSLLRRDGHFLRFAADGAEAAEKARAERFDAILMDIQMPEVDGLEATRRIREAEVDAKQERVPIIGLTAHAFAEDAQRCFEAGMDGYLAKPYHIDDLRRLLAACAQRSPARP
jgi:signal transduction histidine kinase/ActR/RegA family two-component response regulator